MDTYKLKNIIEGLLEVSADLGEETKITSKHMDNKIQITTEGKKFEITVTQLGAWFDE